MRDKRMDIDKQQTLNNELINNKDIKRLEKNKRAGKIRGKSLKTTNKLSGNKTKRNRRRYFPGVKNV